MRPSLLKLSTALAVALYALGGIAAIPQAAAAPPASPLKANNPVPTVTLTPAAPTAIDGFLGSSVTFTATFDNSAAPSGNVGYGPFIDLYLDSSGTHGANGLGTATVTATIFNGSVTLPVQILTFPASGTLTHPLAVNNTGNGITVTGTPGDKLVVIALPFGSFTEDQPPVDVEITVNVDGNATVGSLLDIYARGGFQYGATPLNDWCCGDPSIVNPAGAQPTWAHAQVNPIVLVLTKEHDGLDGTETPTGPNYPRQYTLTVDIANGQTVNNLQVSDPLPNNVQFLSASSVPAGSLDGASTANTTTPGGTVVWDFGNVTGGAGTADAVLTINFYIPIDDSTANPVINPATGTAVTSDNTAQVDGGAWTPTNGDPSISFSSTPSVCTNCPNTLIDRSLAVQKTVAIVVDNGPGDLSPGDTLEYTITFEVSDFFAFQNLVVSDSFGDGQTFDNSFTPTLSVTQNGVTANSSFTMGSDAILGAQNGTTGDTPLTFDVSTLYGQQFVGGLVADGGAADDGPTTGVITFRTTVNDSYTVLFPSGNQSLDQGDKVSNTVTTTGDLLDASTCNPGPCTPYPGPVTVTDDSSTSLVVPKTEVDKSVFAINGAPPATNPPQIKPGDLVTYEIKYDLAIGDFEGLSLVDFLPLPVFFSGDPDANGTNGPAWSFNPATGVAPGAAGEWTYASGDTHHLRAGATDPSVSADSPANSVTWDFGTYDDATNQSATIDLLFTVTVSNKPFTDGLKLTNQVRQADHNTSNVGASGDGIVQVVLTEPVLRTTKSVVSSDNPAAQFSSATAPSGITWLAPGVNQPVQWTPAPALGEITSDNLGSTIDSNVSSVGPNDTLKFVIVVQNTGSSPKGAFDMLIRDTMPPQMQIPGSAAGLNLHITRGDGSAVSFTTLGSGLFDATGGIQLDDPGLAQGACEAHSAGPGNGRDIILISYDLQIKPGVTPGQDIVNTSSLVNYAGEEGGPNHLSQPLTDDAHVLISPTQPGKYANPAVSSVTVGDTYRQRIVVNVPADTVFHERLSGGTGTGIATLRDSILDNGLHAIAASVSSTPIIISSCAVSNPVFAATPVVINDTAAGEDVLFQFAAGAGGIIADNTGGTGPCTFAVEIDVQVMDKDFFDGNSYWLPPDLTTMTASDSAVLEISDGTNNIDTPVGTLDIPVYQPAIRLTKTAPVVFEADKKTQRAPGDEIRRGDYVVYLLQMTNYGQAPAYEVNWVDTLPADVAYVKNSEFFDTNGNGIKDSGEQLAPAPVVTGTTTTGQTLSFNYDTDIPVGGTLNVAFRVQILKTMTLGLLIDNTADADWSTMNGSTNTERIYDDSPAVANDGGQDSDTISLQVIGLELEKSFSPNPVPVGGTSTMTFTITNPNTVTDLTEVTFSDGLPAGLVVATPANAGGTCVGTVTANDGAAKVSFKGGTLAAGATCTITVDVVTSAAQVYNNTTGPISSKETGPGDTASAQLVSGNALSIAKVFTPSSIPPGGVATLTFTLFNGDNQTHTNISFFDTLPLGAPGGAMIVATPPNATSTCNGTWSPAANDTFVQYSGGSLASGASCRLTVDVTAGGPATYTNTTDPLTSNELVGPGNTSNSAVLRVRARHSQGSGGGGSGGTGGTGSGGTATGGGLTLEKSVSPASALAGDTVTWTIRVSYTGTGPSTPITVSDTVSPVFQITNVNATTGTVQQNGNAVSVAIGPMQPGQTVTITIATTLSPDTPAGQVCNDATIGVLNARACMIVLPSELPPTGGRPVDEVAGMRALLLSILGALAGIGVGIVVSRRRRTVSD